MPKAKLYGIKVRFANGHWGTYWYGNDKGLRDRKYSEYMRMDNVLAVKRIEAKS